jgi:hypothetical protein
VSRPKFIQIACSAYPDTESSSEAENLYALDERGDVWWYRFPVAHRKEFGWYRLKDRDQSDSGVD